MPLNLGDIFFKLGADTGGLEKAEKDAKQITSRMEKDANRASSAFASAGKIIAGVITVEAIRRTFMLADAYADVFVRLEALTGKTRDYVAVSEGLKKVSNETGFALEKTASQFERLSAIAPGVGKTNKDVIQFIGTMQKLARTVELDPQKLEMGVDTLARGMVDGTFAANDFKFLMRQSQPIVQLIADGMGMTVQELQLAADAGKVLSKDVFEAILTQTELVNKKFVEGPVSLDTALGRIKVGMTSILGQFDQTLGVTDGVATGLNSAANVLQEDWTPQIEWVADRFYDLSDTVGGFVDIFIDVSDAIGGMGLEGESVLSSLGSGFELLGEVAKQVPIYFRYYFTLAAAGITKIFTDLYYFFQGFGNDVSIVWAEIEDAALSAADGAKIVWFTVGDAILKFFANVMENIAAAVDAIPGLEEEAAAIKSNADAIGKMANMADKATKAAQEGAAARKQHIDALVQEGNIIRQNKADTNEAIQVAVDEAVAVKNAAQSSLKERESARAADRLQRKQDAEDRKKDAEYQNTVIDKLNREANEDYATRLAEKRALEEAAGGKSEAKDAQSRIINAGNVTISQISGIENDLTTELEKVEQWYAESNAIIDAGEASNIETVIPYHEMRERLEDEHLKRMKDAHAKFYDDNNKIVAMGAFLGTDLTKQAGDLTLKEQAESFKSSIDMAAQHSKEFFQIKKAMALATALIEAPKAILSAFTFGTEIGGPPVGAVFAGIAAAATAVQISAIASQQFQGGRAAGGPTYAGGMYRVNENGPELLSTGGKSYLMMGAGKGHVTPLGGKGASAGGGVNVQIIDQRSNGARPQVAQKGDSIEILLVDAVNNAIDAGKLDTTMNRNFGVGRRIY